MSRRYCSIVLLAAAATTMAVVGSITGTIIPLVGLVSGYFVGYLIVEKMTK